ncbi:hypothetical protein FCE95_15740 [Luteimonas gilva]|uniref:Uncharacterized protein n=2 Tax=Luteimonas gilva TaxID=2572684 RepID=A0A4U5JJ44_9GAMM|nr:hypothetical protein FCE95_15740 [Luteimonas gilva]
MLLFGLLIFGILAKPVLAIACEIHDAKRAIAEASQGVSATAPELDQGEGCCALPDCNDCCAHTVAMLPTLAVLRAEPAAGPPLPALSVEFEPAALAVAFRPPILA